MAGLQLVDALNVADRRDEAAHAYDVQSRLGNLRLNATARVEPYADGTVVADGGRAVVGHESFDVKATPGRDLVMVMRTSNEAGANLMRADGSRRMMIAFGEAGLSVEVNGTVAGRLAFVPRPGWDEKTLRVPAALVTGERVRLRLAGRYAAYRYWFYQ